MPTGGKRFSVVEFVAWLVVAFVGVVTITQAIGWAAPTTVAVVQSLTPYLGMALVPVVVLALWRRRLIMATVATAIGFGIALLTVPLAFPDPQPAAAADSVGLRVASLNLWYENPRIDDVDEVLADLDADVIVFSEYTSAHQAALQASPLADGYSYRIDRSGLGATGIAVWSRESVVVAEHLDTFNDSLDLTVKGPDGDVRIVAMHVPTPTVDFDAWRRDLHTAERIGRDATGPTLLIGDLNSSYWHPDFRRLLDAGFVDANAAAGSGFSTSWPTTWMIPPFVRLDHALTTGELVSTAIDDIDVPGSDHRGLIVTVAPTRRAAP